MKKKLIITVLLILLFYPLPTMAKYPYYISIHTAGHVFENNRNIGDTFLLGLGLGYEFNKRLTTAIRFYTGKYDIQYPKDNQTCAKDSKTGNLYHADLYYHFLPEKYIRPFITAGFGKFNIKHSKSEELYHDYYDQGILFNYGVGLEFFVKDVSVLGDVRHFVSSGDSRNEMVLSVGVIFSIGKESQQNY